MKIDSPPQNPAGVRDTTQTKDSGRQPGRASTVERTDEAPFSVDISAAAEKKATEAVDEEQARREKIAAIRAQLAAGSYSISGRDVADRILDSIKG